MSILINGMEMPTSCFECRFSIDGFCYASGHVNIRANEERQITNYCPLIPVPPHGRLIDADAMSKKDNDDFSAAIETAIGFAAKQMMIMAHAQLQKAIEIQPTILPGEEGEG